MDNVKLRRWRQQADSKSVVPSDFGKKHAQPNFHVRMSHTPKFVEMQDSRLLEGLVFWTLDVPGNNEPHKANRQWQLQFCATLPPSCGFPFREERAENS